MISLKTPCGHFIKVPRKQNPYNLEKDDKGNFKRKYLENLRKITCKCLNLVSRNFSRQGKVFFYYVVSTICKYSVYVKSYNMK